MFLDHDNPVTVEVASYPTGRADDFPCIGRRQISGFIDDHGRLFLSAWNNGLHIFDGDSYYTGATFNDNLLVDDNDFHWLLTPIYDTGGIDLIDLNDRWYFLSSGYPADQSGVKGIMSPVRPPDDMFSTFDSGEVFDSDSDGSSIFVLAKPFTLWASDNNGSNWHHYQIDSISVANASIAVGPGYGNYANKIYIAVITDNGDVEYYRVDINVDDDTINIFPSVNVDDTAVSTWIDIKFDEKNNTSYIQYLKAISSASYEIRVKTVDSPNNVTYVALIGTFSDSDGIGNRLAIINKQFGSILINGLGNGFSKTDDLMAVHYADPMVPCSFSSAPADIEKTTPPQISNDGKVVYYMGEHQELYYGVYVSELDCWVYDLPLSYNSSSNDNLKRWDTLFFLKSPYSYRIGFPAFTFIRNMGSNFIEDIALTY